MPEEIFILAIVATTCIGLPAMILHYVTLWRKQKTLLPDDERMMEDLWRSARQMERRIETLERLLDGSEAEDPRRPPRSSRTTFDD
ncbi:MAG: envelope stress response membrane protein PspB [Hyphomonas sp.]|uniref:envelope stress response membrane protein PspB n=1 Tax=Hyphomonas sp. TaxID=87 RepID=UPI0035290370